MTTGLGKAEAFGHQLGALQSRVERLRQRAEGLTGELLAEALAELSVTVEELRVAEEELRVQADQLQLANAAALFDRQRYVDLFNFAPDGYLVTEAAGIIAEANVAAARLLRMPPEELVRKPLAVMVPIEDSREFVQQIARVKRRGGELSWEGRILPRGAPILEVEFVVAAAPALAAGAPPELRWRLHEITERKAAQQAGEQLQQMLRDLSARLQAAREDERTRIARQVHDELGGALTAIKLDLGQVKHHLAADEPVEALAHADDASHLLDVTMNTVRDIATNLRPALLDELGLVAALDWQLQEFEARSSIRSRLIVSPAQVACPPEVAIVVFRVFQELLTNAARHSGAGLVAVRLSQQAGRLVLRVHDDGRGISARQASQVTSLGLHGIRQRAAQLGGQVKITGRAGRGTTVTVSIPLAPRTEPGAS